MTPQGYRLVNNFFFDVISVVIRNIYYDKILIVLILILNWINLWSAILKLFLYENRRLKDFANYSRCKIVKLF